MAVVTVAAAGSALVVPAAAAATIDPDVTLDELTLTDQRAVNTADAIGDDGGFTAITSTHILQTGDGGLAAYDHALTAPADPCAATRMVWGLTYGCGEVDAESFASVLFTDLKTQSAYVFDALPGEAPTFLGFWPLAADGTSTGPDTSRVGFDRPIVMSDELCTVTASGWGRVVIWDRCTGDLYDIALPSGRVTIDEDAWALEAFGIPILNSEAVRPFPVESHGMVEVRAGRLWLALPSRTVEGTSIVRFGVQEAAPATETIHRFAANLDLGSFAVSPRLSMWCAHFELGSIEFESTIDMAEPLFCAGARMTVPTEEQLDDDEPHLAATGAVGPTGAALMGLTLLVLGLAALRSSPSTRETVNACRRPSLPRPPA